MTLICTSWNSSLDCYRVSISFENQPQATGSYSCVSIGDGFEKDQNYIDSTIYIYADNGADLFFLDWNGDLTGKEKLARIVEKERKILIPCITFRPNFQPILFVPSNGSTTTGNLSVLPRYMCHYDSSEGFYLNFTEYLHMEHSYECAISTSSDSPRLRFKLPEVNCTFRPPEVLNEYNEIHSRRKGMTYLICESVHSIKLVRNKDKKFGISKEQDHFYYKYIVEGEFSNEVPVYSISCKTQEDKLLQTWSSSAYTIDIVPPKKIKFDGNKFYCNDTLEKGITMSQINCHNLANCETARKFDPSTAMIVGKRYPYDVDNDYSLASDRQKDIWKIKRDSVCTIISPKQKISLGIVYCTALKNDADQTVAVTSLLFFTDLNGLIVEEMDYRNLDGVLRIPMIGDKKYVYFGETVNFICEASPFIFAKGLKLNILIKNGSENQTTNSFHLQSQETISSNKIILNETIFIGSQYITGVECRAIKLDKKDWESVSLSFQVKVDGKKPEIFTDEFPEKNGTIHYVIDDNNLLKHLMCRATGVPHPSIHWIRKDLKVAILNSTSQNKSGFAVSTLFLNDLHEGHYEYLCIATNTVGETNRTFLIARRSVVQPWVIYTIAIISVIVLLLAFAVIVLCRTLKDKQKQIHFSEAEEREFFDGDESLLNKYDELHEVAQYLPYKQQYEIHPSKIEIKNDVLGIGNFGMVSKGVLEKSGNHITVAVKTVKGGIDIKHLRALLSEIKIMMYVGKHPYVIEMLGSMTKNLREGKLSVVVEYCSNGNLQNYLRSCRQEFQDQIIDGEIKNTMTPMKIHSTRTTGRFFGIENAIPNAVEKRRTRYSCLPNGLKTTQLVNWCYQIGSGMEFLTNKKVIHGDLAARNLLITDNLSVKITDFGLARHLYDYTNYVTKNKSEPLPWRWLSIEAIKDSKFSSQSDVWAYGVTLWEIFSLGETPYQGFSWGEEFVDHLCQGYRMGKPQYATHDIYKTMSECWNTATRDRPSFQDIAKNFKELLEKIGKDVDANTTEKFTRL